MWVKLLVSVLVISQSWAFDTQFQEYDKLLSLVVTENNSSSVVDYSLLKQNNELLKKIVSSFESLDENTYKAMNENQKLAFLINAYNVYTLKLITDNYPIKSIKDAGSLFSSPWKKKIFKLFSTNVSLDMIEHEMIRKNFQEPRIHFAVNCASIGCPALSAEAFKATKIEQQLSKAATKFLSDQARNRFDSVSNTFYVSPIFKWYREDFEKSSGSLENFLKSYFPNYKDQKAEIEFNDYDWNLNKK